MSMTKKTESIVNFFRKHGPATSSDYIDHVVKGVVDPDQKRKLKQAARKNLGRARKEASQELKTFDKIKSKNGSMVIYIEGQQHQSDFARTLGNVLGDRGSAYGCALTSLWGKSGICTAEDWEVVSGSPMQKRTKHLHHDTIVERLVANGIVTCHQFEGQTWYSSYVVSDIVAATNERKAQIQLEHIMLELMLQWLRNNSFVSYSAVTTRLAKQLTVVSGYRWDLTGPSYLSPMTTGGSNGFVVLDVHSNAINLERLRYFLKKVKSIKAVKNSRPILPILVALRFTPTAWAEAKSAGIVPASIDMFFGKNMFKQFRLLQKLYSRKTLIENLEVKDVQELLGAFEAFGVNEGSMRGSLFEMICISILSSSATVLHTGVEYKSLMGDVEMDVIARTGNSLRVIEAKAYRDGLICIGKYDKPGDLEHWISKRIPIMRKWIESISVFGGHKLVFEFWTTSGFTPEAHQHVEEHNAQTNKYILKLVDHQMLCERTHGNIYTMLKQHFNPLKKKTKQKSMKLDYPKTLPRSIALTFPKVDIGQAFRLLNEAFREGLLGQNPTEHECLAFLGTEPKMKTILKRTGQKKT